MYKLITTARGCDDLSIGFDRSRDRRQRKLNNNKKREISCQNLFERHIWICTTLIERYIRLGIHINTNKK